MAEWNTPKTDWVTNPKNPVAEDFNRIEGNIAFLKQDIETKKGAIVNALNTVGLETQLTDTHAQIANKILAANQGTKIYTPSAVNQPIPKGFHSGQGYVKGDLGYILSKPEILTSTERQDVLNTYADHIKDSIHAMRMVMNSDLWLDNLLASSTIFGKYLTEPSIQAMTETTKALQKIGHNQARINQILGNSAAFSLFKNHSWQGRVWFMNGPVGYIPMVRGYSWNTEGEYLGDAESPPVSYMGTVAWPQRTGNFTLVHTFSIIEASAHQNECALVSDFAIDLTNVSKIELYYFAPASDRSTDLFLIAGTNKRVSYTNYTVRAVRSSNSPIFNGSLSLDVSELAGEYYVRVHNKNYSSTGFRVVYPTRIGLV